jgi:hypothetical protein
VEDQVHHHFLVLLPAGDVEGCGRCYIRLGVGAYLTGQMLKPVDDRSSTVVDLGDFDFFKGSRDGEFTII